MDIGLRHLRIVLAVAESGSIGRAAVALGIAQSGLTTQLRRVEREFGGPLFRRRPNGVVPTELGRYVLGRAGELLDGYGELLAAARMLAEPAEPPGTVAVGGVDSPWLTAVGALVRARMPERDHVTYMESTSLEALAMLRAGTLALAVVGEFSQVGPLPVRGLLVRAFAARPVLIGLGAGHRLADRPAVALADLADEDWVSPGDRCDSLGLSLRLGCERAGFTPRFRYFGADRAQSAAVVAAGRAVGVFTAPADRCPGLVLRPVARAELWHRTSLVCEYGSPLARLAQDVDDRLVDDGRPPPGHLRAS